VVGAGSSKTGECTELLRRPSCSSPVRQSSSGGKLLASFNPSASRAASSLASIVALPFANANGNPGDEELAAALTEDATLSLEQIPRPFGHTLELARSRAAPKTSE
jgi:hypothetical protein